MKYPLRSLLACLLAAASLLALPAAMAATFALESTTVILEESEGQTAFGVTNHGDQPLLLVTRLEELGGGPPMAGRILISPPITRIDPGQSQQVNFSLKQGAPLQREVMLRAAFEGITPQAENGQLSMPVRQEIGLLIQPAAVPRSSAPWRDLSLSIANGELVLSNPGRHVVRLSRNLRLQPGNAPVQLEHAWLMSGEVRRVPIAQPPPQAIRIVPMSRYGFVLPDVTLPVSQ